MLLNLLVILFAFHVAHAQNYKAAKIDASGKIADKEGVYIGSVSKKGVIKDASGAKVGHMDATGTLDRKSVV